MDWWMVGATANAVTALAYLAISGTIAAGLGRAGQWRRNPLAVATGAIFFTCAVHHGAHSVHMTLPAFGLEAHGGEALRHAFDNWTMSSWDVLAAAVGVWYWTLRGRFPALVRGAAVFEDLRERQRQALEIHDNVVQGLATAKLSLELGDPEQALAALDGTLASARHIITELLGEEGSGIELGPGDLRRSAAARAS